MYLLEETFNYILTFNLITTMFYFYSVIVIVIGNLINFGRFLSFPQIIIDIYEYGKLSSKKEVNYLHFIQVPKWWFVHFYIAAAVLSLSSCFLFWFVNIERRALPKLVGDLLNFLTTKERYPAVNGQLSYIALLVYSIHVFKRLYESLFVSVFSNSKMNVVHYIVGHTHYIGAFVGLLSLFPGFTPLSGVPTEINLSDLSLWEVCSIFVVILASFFQFISLKILADLRKYSNSKRQKDKYSIPSGSLFTYVSCPHMLMEMLVYIGIASLMGFQHSTWNIVCLFVCCNQIQMGILNHEWYKQHFRNYPPHRKAILPFIF